MKFAIAAALILVPLLIAWQLLRARETYRYASSRNALENAGKALVEHHRVHGKLGMSLKLRQVDAALPSVDAWQNEFFLDCGDHEFTLMSLGSDLRSGGEGSARDIVSRWKAGQNAPTLDAAPLSP